MSWYREGVVTLTTGSKTVTGVGTNWVDNVLPAGIFMTPTGMSEVEDVVNDTTLLLADAYAGPTASGITYRIIPTQGFVPALAKKVGTLLGSVGQVKDAYEAGELVDTLQLDAKADSDALAAAGGGLLVGYDGGTLQDIADFAKPMQSYAALRAYTGRARGVRITSTGIAGNFERDLSDTSTADNGGTVIVDASGRRWKRLASEQVNVRWFGAKGDGGTDDTVAVHAGITFAKSVGAALYFPAGVYRVTYGFVQATVRHNVCIFGPGRTTDDTNLNLGAIILLDSTDPASFFYEGTASHQFYAHNIRFRCAQFVKDRKFWKNNTSTILNHGFHRVAFERVEKPICYLSGSYFQSASFSDVQFNDSGTFHSELGGNNLRGTLLTLNNVSHDGQMLDNTAKVACDFSGVRLIQGTNFLLEGTLPGVGWTILKLNDLYDAAWGQAPTANFNGFFNEWNGFAPAYSVEQIGGRVSFSFTDLRLSAVSKYKASGRAQVHVSEAAFTTLDVVNDLFELDDYKSRVIIERSVIRRSDLADERFLFRDCSRAPDAGVAGEAMGSALSSNGQGGLIFKWDGGFFDADPVAMVPTGGTVFTPSADATYGRKMLLTPSGNALAAQVRVKLRAAIRPFSQFWVVALVKFPVFTGGQFAIQPIEDNVAKSGGSGYDTSFSGQTVFVCFSTRMLTATTSIGVSFSTIAATGVIGDLECYALALYSGSAAPRTEYPDYPKNIQTYSSAPPTTGAWIRGDIVWNTSPSAAGIPGWVCTASGTPGTWKPMAVLGA